uniref:Cyclic nucleotide-binding domain-containing protein n=1 Tax=Phaeomonas parva TaxID=124430 RepID=A0A7S1TUD6_9STRA|mmetsp:Transcript_18210/g.55644  ORF Transcript_18210/g.55644 Transcript_18210/m.55644 type:complete len:731 (+) Transcript_18210:103-2295(+)
MEPKGSPRRSPMLSMPRDLMPPQGSSSSRRAPSRQASMDLDSLEAPDAVEKELAFTAEDAQEDARDLLMDHLRRDRSRRDTVVVARLLEHATGITSHLSRVATQCLAAEVGVVFLKRDNVLFFQGDAPEAYYYILDGEVGVFAQAGLPNGRHPDVRGSFEPQDFDEDGRADARNEKRKLGLHVVNLRQGTGFGELAFLNPGSEKQRSASIVGMGNERHLQLGIGKPDITVLLRIPGSIYTEHFVPYQEGKQSFSQKMAFMQKHWIFSHWPKDLQISLAYAMKRRKKCRGEPLVNPNDTSNNVYFISSGKVRMQRLLYGTRETGQMKSRVHVATLSEGDIVGIVECLHYRSANEERAAVCETDVEAWSVPVHVFRDQLLPRDQKLSRRLLQLCQKRMDWERFCLEHYSNFAKAPAQTRRNLEGNNYALNMSSCLLPEEVRIRSRLHKKISGTLRQGKRLLLKLSDSKRSGMPLPYDEIRKFEEARRFCEGVLSMVETLEADGGSREMRLYGDILSVCSKVRRSLQQGLPPVLFKSDSTCEISVAQLADQRQAYEASPQRRPKAIAARRRRGSLLANPFKAGSTAENSDESGSSVEAERDYSQGSAVEPTPPRRGSLTNRRQQRQRREYVPFSERASGSADEVKVVLEAAPESSSPTSGSAPDARREPRSPPGVAPPQQPERVVLDKAARPALDEPKWRVGAPTRPTPPRRSSGPSPRAIRASKYKGVFFIT